jgi:hypothetical protein
LRRDRFVTGPGPEAGGSKPVRKGCAQMPEKSGIAGAPAPFVDCPNAAVVAAPANATNKRKSRRARMVSPSWLASSGLQAEIIPSLAGARGRANVRFQTARIGPFSPQNRIALRLR